MTPTSIVALAFGLGLANALHCASMCGPFAFQAHRLGGLKSLVLYWLGKSCTYAFLGALAGSALAWVNGPLVPRAQAALSLLTAALLLLAAWRVAFPKRVLGARPNPLSTLYRSVGSLVQGLPPHRRSFGLGVTSGLLPCGVLGIAFLQAAATGTPWRGSLSLVAFGVGTLPALILAALVASRLQSALRPAHAKVLLVTLLLGVAIITGLRARSGLAPNASLESPACCH